MGSRRTLIIIAAVAVAAIAAIANVTYLNNTQNRAYENARRVFVYRVKADVAKGTTGEAAVGKDLVERKQIPQEFRPGNALVSLDAIKGKVALANLSAGQVLVDGMFVDPINAQTTTRDRNRLAITSELFGAWALGARNLLCLSGDPIKVGDHPDAATVNDES